MARGAGAPGGWRTPGHVKRGRAHWRGAAWAVWHCFAERGRLLTWKCRRGLLPVPAPSAGQEHWRGLGKIFTVRACIPCTCGRKALCNRAGRTYTTATIPVRGQRPTRPSPPTPPPPFILPQILILAGGCLLFNESMPSRRLIGIMVTMVGYCGAFGVGCLQPVLPAGSW